MTTASIPSPLPSVGRIVHFYKGPDEAPIAAIVSAVTKTGAVHLTLFGPGGYGGQHASDVPHGEGSFPYWVYPPRV